MKKTKVFILLCLLCIISIGASAETIPNDEIWYTSTDGNVVTPYNAGVFGATIVSNTYSGGKGVIRFDSNVTTIGKAAFRMCSSLKSIEIPNSVTTIGEDAFEYCSGLASIEIPNSITTIGKYAFNNCSGLTSIEVDDSNTKYDDGDGSNCIIETSTNTLILGCKTTIIPNSVTTIGTCAFQRCSSLTSITIPNSVTSIGESAFQSCSSLTSVSLGNSVTTIGGQAFYDCPGLTSVEIPNSVTSIGRYAFYYCSGLTSINIPNSVTSIGESAFRKSGLINITIPNSVTTIEKSAFYDCTALKSVFVKWESSSKLPNLHPSNIYYSDDDVFPYKTCDLYVPKGTTSLYSAKEYWKKFKSIQEYVTQVTIPASGKASFSSTFDMAIPSGVTAYYASAVEGSNVKMEPIADNIPANTGVVLKGTPSTAYDFIMISSASAIVGNLLVATDGETEVPAGTYVLSGGAFHPLSEAYVIPAGKAYLNYSGSAAKLQVDFGESTSINDVKEADTQVKRNKYLENGRIVILNNNKKYNLAGQRLD